MNFSAVLWVHNLRKTFKLKTGNNRHMFYSITSGIQNRKNVYEFVMDVLNEMY
jgi:hypothetical protein